ncbi:MAG: tryptophan--tRNA ligase, partial [Deltaproteobacteria bacterium]|nr:tryptophan--tRNA ligase [Deltaproteobacteria bacterium]
MTDESKKRVFSGIQPSGNLTIGNYLGAIKNWAAEQPNYHNVFCVVGLHALTVPQDPEGLYNKSREVTLLYLACGLDLEHCAIFLQSHIPAHSELTWLLNCVTPTGWLERMTQYKDKSVKQESISTGLLDYPVLMAADIILYDSHYVPVGEDQKQHVELTRDIAQRFNHLYGETFVVPEVLIPKAGSRIKALDEPTAKM